MASHAAYWRRVCAVCGTSGELHEHFLVPRSLGGPRALTVMLCPAHNAEVRGLPFTPSHRALTLQGLARARAAGKKLGSPNLAPDLDAAMARKGRATQTSYAEMHLDSVWPVIEAARLAGARSLRQLAQALDEAGVRPPRAKGRWHVSQVHRLLARRDRSGD